MILISISSQLVCVLRTLGTHKSAKMANKDSMKQKKTFFQGFYLKTSVRLCVLLEVGWNGGGCGMKLIHIHIYDELECFAMSDNVNFRSILRVDVAGFIRCMLMLGMIRWGERVVGKNEIKTLDVFLTDTLPSPPFYIRFWLLNFSFPFFFVLAGSTWEKAPLEEPQRAHTIIHDYIIIIIASSHNREYCERSFIRFVLFRCRHRALVAPKKKSSLEDEKENIAHGEKVFISNIYSS